jgi:hypothetical protein
MFLNLISILALSLILVLVIIENLFGFGQVLVRVGSKVK